MSIIEVGTKHDGGKPRMDLLDPEFLLEMGRVMEYGSIEYGDRNWEKGITYGRLYAAILRHALGFWKGEAIDRESNLKALAHVAVDAMMLASMSPEWDDRIIHGLRGVTIGSITIPSLGTTEV
jgi:hypothetical protein